MKNKILACLLIGLLSVNIWADDKQKSMAELSKELSNPLAQIWNISVMYNYQTIKGDMVDGKDHMNVGVFQPVLPIPMGDEYTFFARPVIPFIEGPTGVGVTGGTPSNPVGHGTNRSFDIGDMMLPIGMGVVKKEGWSWGGGVTFILPTSQNDLLGSHQWQAGPTALALWANKDWTIGTHMQHWWGFAKASGFDEYETKYANHTDIQYFVIKNLPNAWQVRMSPHATVDWNAPSGEQWTVPIGLGIGKMIKIGPMPVMLMAEYQKSIIKPDSVGNDSTIMLQVNFIIKNPFGDL